ncbi:MAG: hypothetical protein ACLQVJ_12310 [Syntrophobacteraceae bacterium]
MDHQKPNWRNYSDHPLVVGIVVVAALVGIVIFITGKTHLLEFFGSAQRLHSRDNAGVETIPKPPEESVSTTIRALPPPTTTKTTRIPNPPFTIGNDDTVLVNSPKDIVDWINSIQDPFERDEQKKRLWHKSIRAAGKIDRITASKGSVYFWLSGLEVDLQLDDSTRLISSGDSILVSCIIEDVFPIVIQTSACRLEKIAR